jgi:hypothetical protein
VTPIAHFDAVWARCAHLSSIHAYVANNVAAAVRPEELLRAEWVARIGALDLYIHELVAQRMVAIFEGRASTTPAFSRFQLSTETLIRIRTATSLTDASAAFDLEVRDKLRFQTFQDPDKVADGIRLVSKVELWNEVAATLGATPATRTDEAKNIKRQLSLVVRRRNQIAHEGDLQPNLLREPWPITQQDLTIVAALVERIVRAIDGTV